MAYDDDGSMWNWRDIEDLVSMLARYQNSLDVIKLSALVQSVHAAFGGGRGQDVPVAQLADSLRSSGLGAMPFETVSQVLDLVGQVDADADPLEHVTLRQAQRLARA